MTEDQKNQNPNPDPDQKAPEPAPDKESDAGGSISLARKYKLGPFKKKPRYRGPSGDTSAMTAEAPQAAFTAASAPVQAPPAKKWDYPGTLTDKRTYVLTYHSMDLSVVCATAQSTQRDHGFQFNRNGMHYRIEFLPVGDDPYYVQPIHDHFTICQHEDNYQFMHCRRPMTKQEAEYALEIIENELHPSKKQQLGSVLEQLRKNIPTNEYQGKDKSWNEYVDEARRNNANMTYEL